jgi:hypothetical protein
MKTMLFGGYLTVAALAINGTSEFSFYAWHNLILIGLGIVIGAFSAIFKQM